MIYLLTRFGFVMLFSAFAASFLRIDFAVIIAVTAAFTGICLRIFEKRFSEICALFLAAAMGFGLVSVRLATDFYPSKALDGITAEITGTVTEVSAGGGNPVYTVKTDSVGFEDAPQKITVKISGWDEISAESYDKISCSVTFSSYGGESISSELTDRSGGVSIYAYTNEPMEVIGRDESSIGYFVHLIREKISGVIYRYFIDWHAPFMEQLLIGTRGELDSEISSAFRKSGMSHILAISGMHMVIIIELLEKLLRYRKTDGTLRRIETVVLIFAVAAYMFIGGLGMSVLRSGFMLIAHYLAKLLFSSSKSLDNLGIAIVAVLLMDPMAACDTGFLMSAFSCCAISVFAPPFKKFVTGFLKTENRPLAEFFIEAFCVSVVAFLAVLPVSAITFGEISLVAPFSNLFAGFFAQYALICGFLTVALGFVPFLGFFAGGTAFIAMLCSNALLKIAETFAALPFAYIGAKDFWFFLWLVGAAVLIIAPAIYSESFRYIRHSLFMSVFVLLAAILVNHIFYSGVAEIKISSLEHGTAVSCSMDGESVLITRGLGSGDRFDLDSSSSDYDVIISLGAESGPEELELVSASEPEIAFLTFSDAAGRYDGAQTVSAGKVSFMNGAFAEIISDSVFTFEINGVTLLYIFEECDIMDIEPKFRRADIIILDGASPEDFPALRSDYLILCETGGYYSGTSEIIVFKEGKISFFAYNKNLRKGWTAE